MPANKELGQLGEREAIKFLKKQGFKILEKNFRVKNIGEIDIVAQDGDTLVFVEVKTLSSDRFKKPFEMVSPKKIARIRTVGNIYQDQTKCILPPMRVDVVSIEVMSDQKLSFEHFMGVEQW